MSTCQNSGCSSSCTPNPVSSNISHDAVSVDRPKTFSSVFVIPKMDCPSEENLIRMALAGVDAVATLEFDLAAQRLKVTHTGEAERITEKLRPLNLGATLVETAQATPTNRNATRFSIPKMDCAAEENLIRMALANLPGVGALSFDLSKRELLVIHSGPSEAVLEKLALLNLGVQLIESVRQDNEALAELDADGDASEARTLRLLLAINGAMFVLEMLVGWVAQSTGLIADSLDMFADAAVYGLALYAVGRGANLKIRAAHIAGWLQLALALGALVEVARRAAFGSEPQSSLMMGMGLVALVANVTCLVLIARKRDRGAHMTASYIFSANDVIANLGVIAAGVLVAWTASPYPDLIIGTIIGLVVLSGARRILMLK
ncbi:MULTISPECIES: cation transporter [Pseudomonadota]|uniref:cation transporter n=1 Tax=Pseudomonadota TaxID=1224 RepID=UPI001AC01D2A|nr:MULTISPECIES: cation transporter [Pseudomonadota]MBN8780510.1 cation transporter [Thiobacillus sp.]